MKRAAAVVMLAVAVAVAGCGGPSEREQLDRWARDADAACEQAERSIARRGAPRDIPSLIALAAGGSRDARAAIAKVLALEVPDRPGEAGRARAALREVDHRLRPLGSIRSLRDLRALDRAVSELEEGLEALSAAGREAGLRVCGRPAASSAALDAVRTPVYWEWFRARALRFARKMTGLAGRDGSPDQVQSALIGMALAISDAQNDTARLEPPSWADAGVERYQRALLDLRAAVADARDPYLSPRPPSLETAVRGLKRVDRTLDRPIDAADALIDRFERRLGRPSGGDPQVQPS